MRQLTNVTFAVPNFLIITPLSKLERIVPNEIVMDMIPAALKGTPKSLRITGQAEPSKESGNPKLMNAK
jgi:hypothetical protein